MVWQVLIPAAATLLGAGMASRSAKRAAEATGAAADRATELQREMFERQIELNKPYREAGEAALNRLIPLATEYAPFGTQQFQADPGYAFRMAEGMKGLERSAAARGGLLSGATLRGIQNYGQDLASQEYQNAFNRYQAERQARLGPLQSLAGVGQTTAQQLGQAGQGYAANVGNIGMGQAQIAGQAGLARASAYGNALNQLAYLGGRYFGAPQAPAPGGGGAPSIGYQDPYASFRYGNET
jgi:hypothetical protein